MLRLYLLPQKLPRVEERQTVPTNVAPLFFVLQGVLGLGGGRFSEGALRVLEHWVAYWEVDRIS